MELIQHVLVTVVAFGAATFIGRRVFTTLAPVKGSPRCASCQTGGRRRAPEGATSAAPLIQIAADSTALRSERHSAPCSTSRRLN